MTRKNKDNLVRQIRREGTEAVHTWRRANPTATLDLSGTDLTDVHLAQAYLVGADLSGSNLRRAFLFGARLDRAVLRRTNFAQARLMGAVFHGAVLEDADFTCADLSMAFFDANTGFIKANLQNAQLWGCTGLPAAIKDAYIAALHASWQ